MMLYVLRLDEREYMRDLALAQVAVDQDNGIKKFDAYRKLMFPWVETAKKRTEEEMRRVLDEETKRGPIGVTALSAPSFKSRLHQPPPSTARNLTPRDLRRQDDLFKKIGTMHKVKR